MKTGPSRAPVPPTGFRLQMQALGDRYPGFPRLRVGTMSEAKVKAV